MHVHSAHQARRKPAFKTSCVPGFEKRGSFLIGGGTEWAACPTVPNGRAPPILENNLLEREDDPRGISWALRVPRTDPSSPGAAVSHESGKKKELSARVDNRGSSCCMVMPCAVQL